MQEIILLISIIALCISIYNYLKEKELEQRTERTFLDIQNYLNEGMEAEEVNDKIYKMENWKH